MPVHRVSIGGVTPGLDLIPYEVNGQLREILLELTGGYIITKGTWLEAAQDTLPSGLLRTLEARGLPQCRIPEGRSTAVRTEVKALARKGKEEPSLHWRRGLYGRRALNCSAH